MYFRSGGAFNSANCCTDHVIDSQLSRPIKIHQLDMSSRQLLALQWQLSAHNYAAKADDFMYSREDIFKRNFHFKIMYIYDGLVFWKGFADPYIL